MRWDVDAVPEVAEGQPREDAAECLVVGQGDLIHVARQPPHDLFVADNRTRVRVERDLGLQVPDDFEPVTPVQGIAKDAPAQRVEVGRARPQEVVQNNALLRYPDREVVIVGDVLRKELHLHPEHVQFLTVLHGLVRGQKRGGLAALDLTRQRGVRAFGWHEVVELGQRP